MGFIQEAWSVESVHSGRQMFSLMSDTVTPLSASQSSIVFLVRVGRGGKVLWRSAEAFLAMLSKSVLDRTWPYSR
jgi:hypothetical protein